MHFDIHWDVNDEILKQDIICLVENYYKIQQLEKTLDTIDTNELAKIESRARQLRSDNTNLYSEVLYEGKSREQLINALVCENYVSEKLLEKTDMLKKTAHDFQHNYFRSIMYLLELIAHDHNITHLQKMSRMIIDGQRELEKLDISITEKKVKLDELLNHALNTKELFSKRKRYYYSDNYPFAISCTNHSGYLTDEDKFGNIERMIQNDDVPCDDDYIWSMVFDLHYDGFDNSNSGVLEEVTDEEDLEGIEDSLNEYTWTQFLMEYGNDSQLSRWNVISRNARDNDLQ